MGIVNTTEIDFEIVDGRFINVRRADIKTRVIGDEEEEIERKFTRWALAPGDDLTGQDAAVAAAATELWTTQVIAAYQAEQAALYPPPSPPSTDPHDYKLKPFQFFAMLKIAGVEQAVADAIAAIEDPAERAVAEARLYYSMEYDRGSPLIDQLAPAVGLTVEQIDQYWMQAKEL